MDLFLILGICLIIGIAEINSMHMPNDVEIMDGYSIDMPQEDIYPHQDTFLESRSLIGHRLFKAIRDKRSVYKVLESPGLKSHFQLNEPLHVQEIHKIGVSGGNTNGDEYMQEIAYTKLHPPPRERREVEDRGSDTFQSRIARDTDSNSTSSEEKALNDNVKQNNNGESLPTPEKQVMEPGYYREARSRMSFANDHMQEEEDAMAEASVNEGIKARAPRVNFITQPKDSDIDKLENRDQKPSMARAAEIYKKPIYDAYSSPRYYDDYRTRNSDNYYRYNTRYDRDRDQYSRYPDDYYDYRRRDDYYDPYMPFVPPHPNYYYYPDRRYDVPEQRSYPTYQSFANDVNYPTVPNRNRRIIYYTNLPEIVRTPPNVDLRYRNYNKYPENNYNYPSISESYRNYRNPKDYLKSEQSTIKPASVSQEEHDRSRDRDRNRNNRDHDIKKSDNYDNRDSVKLSSGLRVQEPQVADHRIFADMSNSRINDFTQPHYRME